MLADPTTQVYGLTPIADLVVDPDNPRRHDAAAIAESVEANGWIGYVVVDPSGRVLAGHGALAELAARGATHAPTITVDVDPVTADRIGLADNETQARGSYDQRLLAEALSVVLHDAGSVAGTAFTADDLADLSAALGPTFDDDDPTVPPARRPATSEAGEELHNSDTAASWAERAEAQAARGLRTLVLAYPPDDHSALVAAAERLCATRGVPSYSALFADLLGVPVDWPTE